MPRILIVDDNQDFGVLLSRALEKLGAETQSAATGREAFRVAGVTAFDLIIMDMMMPDWDGYTAIQTISLGRPDQKFLVVSAIVDEEIHARVTENKNVIGWITKPFRLDAVLDVIKDAVDFSATGELSLEE
jgi:CheY-like chemotaxis protein